jgi:hypothetical protein
MTASVLLKALTLWGVILVLAIINGTVREKALIPAMGELGGLVASGAILSACVFLLAFFSAGWFGAAGAAQFWLIGVLWLVLTLIFEFGFGRLVQHKGWSELLQAYTFKGGNIWPIVLAVTLVSPWLTARLRGLVI